MIHVAYFDVTGRITSVDSGPAASFGDMPWCIKITVTQLATVERTHHVDLVSRTLKAGMLANPNPPSWIAIRSERTFLLDAAGMTLQEYNLPDSYPLLSKTEKQLKKDALIAYRQALRDITKQADPANIVWPTLPA